MGKPAEKVWPNVLRAAAASGATALLSLGVGLGAYAWRAHGDNVLREAELVRHAAQIAQAQAEAKRIDVEGSQLAKQQQLQITASTQALTRIEAAAGKITDKVDQLAVDVAAMRGRLDERDRTKTTAAVAAANK